MLYHEEAVKSNLRNRDGKRVFYLNKGDQLTSGARDFLQRERIPILPADKAKPDRYKLLNGAYLEEKPEHMTHLNGEILVSKTHPRIRFRGMLDSLEAELILCQLRCPSRKEELGEILALTRQIIRCDVLEEPLHWEKLCGLTEQEQRKNSHFPQEYYGQPHFMPVSEDGLVIAHLNRVRCCARQAELSAAQAFCTEEGNVTRPDILRAMNRMSSMLYILMIREKANK